MAAGLLSGLLPNMMQGADQAIAPIQQVLEGGSKQPTEEIKSKTIEEQSKDHHKKHKSKKECEEDESERRQRLMEETIRKLILILLLFLLLFIIFMGLFALGHHARWRASLLPDPSAPLPPLMPVS